jgi:hypothetical protein
MNVEGAICPVSLRSRSDSSRLSCHVGVLQNCRSWCETTSAQPPVAMPLGPVSGGSVAAKTGPHLDSRISCGGYLTQCWNYCPPALLVHQGSGVFCECPHLP